MSPAPVTMPATRVAGAKLLAGILSCLLACGAAASVLRVGELRVGSLTQGPAAPAAANPTILLPIEVLGWAGATVQVSLTLTQAVESLRISANGLAFSNKASLQLDSATPLLLNNSTVTFTGMEAAWGGIGGPFGNHTFTVPADLAAGTHTLTLRYPRTASHVTPGGSIEDSSVGFRIWGLEALTSAGANVLVTAFTNTANYEADPDLVALGAKLWRGTNALNERYHLASPTSLSLSNSLVATCADCHFADGLDLWLTRTSPKAIIERSRLHELTDDEAEAVVAYLLLSHTNVARPDHAQPWSELFLPGPGVDDAGAGAWYAGSTNKDAQRHPELVLNSLHPGLVTLAGDELTWDTNAITWTNLPPHRYISPRETPTMLPMLGLSAWLPRVHPLDAFTNAPALTNFIYDLDLMAAAAAEGDRYSYGASLGQLFGHHDDMLAAYGHEQWSTNTDRNRKFLDLGRLGAMKLWEHHQSHGMFEDWELTFGDRAEPMALLIYQWIFNKLSPDILQLYSGTSGLGDSRADTAWRNAWYVLQRVMYMGHRLAEVQASSSFPGIAAGAPIDVAYQRGGALQNLAQLGVAVFSESSAWHALFNQFYDTGVGPEYGFNFNQSGPQSSGGWNAANTHPRWFCVVGVYPDETTFWGAVPLAVRGPLIDSYLVAWATKMATYDRQDFRDGAPGLAFDDSFLPPLEAPSFLGITSADKLYHRLLAGANNQTWEGMGASDAALNQVVNLGTNLWPEWAASYEALRRP